ncbi:pyridoxal-phosphate-dependent aminotransferase family protein [Meiothermus granaticius]|uniref:Soluble hydrogenase 42 kDa subunit n=1 Tax=Meiothermus granaticius NBRC 107808 TaxID=1227551 RepID=A0A399F9I8_9DEIN|nr:aminotransferase class V-fold PLP-dependent enzyme [Meiothermus granaticius]RIH92763.1 Soluble hydrogenase 42 kDa subunit [Meiothermus granaticius NBRC 107808]GEM87342.1 aspartate aminotransferase [Meiothermus granaticius NBRC 107808]
MLVYRNRLLTPGPVELHPKALEALSRPQLHHRSDAAKQVFLQAKRGLEQAFQTQGQALLLTGSGTSGMEALVQNLFAPGDRVLVPVHGNFSERWARIAQQAGLEVERMELEWGRVVHPEYLEGPSGPFQGLLLTHSESSTGALNDVQGLAQAFKARFPQALVVVDAITSLFVSEFALEGWGLDAAVAGSQKGLMCPPGLAYVALSPRALECLKPRGFYLNLASELKVQNSGESAWTPAINLVAATAAVLEELLPHLPEHLALKQRQNQILYTTGQGLGLKPVPEVQSPATTCFYLPEGTAYPQVKEAFARRGATIIGGQGQLKGKVFRVSLMGYSDLYDAYAVAELMREALRSQ